MGGEGMEGQMARSLSRNAEAGVDGVPGWGVGGRGGLVRIRARAWPRAQPLDPPARVMRSPPALLSRRATDGRSVAVHWPEGFLVTSAGLFLVVSWRTSRGQPQPAERHLRSCESSCGDRRHRRAEAPLL